MEHTNFTIVERHRNENVQDRNENCRGPRIICMCQCKNVATSSVNPLSQEKLAKIMQFDLATQSMEMSGLGWDVRGSWKLQIQNEANRIESLISSTFVFIGKYNIHMCDKYSLFSISIRNRIILIYLSKWKYVLLSSQFTGAFTQPLVESHAFIEMKIDENCV